MNTLTASQMAALDRDLVKMGISVERMMEYAGLFPALLAAKFTKKRVLCLVGTGNNGGDCLVAARHLINWGYSVDIVFASQKLKEHARQQWRILQKMRVKRTKKPTWSSYGVILDGLLGYNMRGSPRPAFAKLIDVANESGVPVIAIDVPSGWNAATGEASSPTIRAKATVMLSAEKVGLRKKSAKKYAGKLYLAYMSIPPHLCRKYRISPFDGEHLLLSV